MPAASSVIVVDNDAEARAGAAVVEEIAPTFRLPLRAAHRAAPRPHLRL